MATYRIHQRQCHKLNTQGKEIVFEEAVLHVTEKAM